MKDYQLFISAFITNHVCVSWTSHDILLFYWRKSMSAYRRHWRDILEGPEALICTAGNASGCNPVDSLSLSLSLSLHFVPFLLLLDPFQTFLLRNV